MMTGIDVAMIALNLIENEGLSISGIVSFGIPVDDQKENIVIVPLPISYGQLQEGILDVRCCVPNLKAELQQDVITEFAAVDRINTITKEVLALVDDYAEQEVYFTVEELQLIDQQSYSYMNIKVAVRTKNL
ncbi:hypothetical protein ABE426_14470 [Sphingobacterium faecium]|uniref:hypothetical protein n=1 Tax=Sphingobacterium faecium TaxID=34087 RepID=UPI00320AD070